MGKSLTRLVELGLEHRALLNRLCFPGTTLHLMIADRTQEALFLGFAVDFRPLATGFDFAERSHQGLDALVWRLAEVPPNGFVEVQVHWRGF